MRFFVSFLSVLDRRISMFTCLAGVLLGFVVIASLVMRRGGVMMLSGFVMPRHPYDVWTLDVLQALDSPFSLT
jgi:hypothetical protein